MHERLRPRSRLKNILGGSLGNLIPPGIALIVYGAMTNTSVGQLYAAAVIPAR